MGSSSPRPYPSDLTDEQWALIEPMVPVELGGRPATYSWRRIVEVILYLDRAGCSWRMLPHDFPPWQQVSYYFTKWKKDGTLAALQDGLREQVRQKDKPVDRTTACVDSQTSDSHGTQEGRGFDGGKKLEGRKRHLGVDSLGLVLAVVVTAGNVTDAQGAMACLEQMEPQQYPRLTTFFGDSAYRKEGFPDKLQDWKPGCRLTVITRSKEDEVFVKLPIRWVVERTHAWLTKNRRLCRSYEHTTSSEAAFVRIAMIHRNVRRLSPSPAQSPFRFKRPPKCQKQII